MQIKFIAISITTIFLSFIFIVNKQDKIDFDQYSKVRKIIEEAFDDNIFYYSHWRINHNFTDLKAVKNNKFYLFTFSTSDDLNLENLRKPVEYYSGFLKHFLKYEDKHICEYIIQIQLSAIQKIRLYSEKKYQDICIEFSMYLFSGFFLNKKYTIYSDIPNTKITDNIYAIIRYCINNYSEIRPTADRRYLNIPIPKKCLLSRLDDLRRD